MAGKDQRGRVVMLRRVVAETPVRDRRVRATRTRIAETALELFVSQGYAETTFDQIARAAEVGRRTIFRHFATKEAILFDHLVVRRDAALQLLRERPPAEPPLVSLHAVLRELCAQGYDRRALSQIRAVLATDPQIAGEQFAGGLAFEKHLVTTLQMRHGEQWSLLELDALTRMALSWLDTACNVYFKEDRPSLVRCFDETVGFCMESVTGDLARSLRRASKPARRATRAGR
jgi:AcrR family transcriptional regulator